jgi:hypothetical protein
MNLTPEEENFVKEVANRAKVQNASPGLSTPIQNAPLAVMIPTKVGRVSVSPQENNNLNDICKRTGKTGPELINKYL